MSVPNFGLVIVGTGVALLSVFTGTALGYAIWYRRHRPGATDTDAYITARGTQPFGRIAWAFFCASFGARFLVSGPPVLAATQGIAAVGVAALTAGLPILLFALGGSRARVAVPDAVTFSDWIACRFGPVAKTIVAGIALLSMGTALVAEYSALGVLAESLTGAPSWVAPFVVAIVTAATAAFGGLRASLSAHQVRGAAVYALLVAVAVYIGVNYHSKPIPSPLPAELGPTAAAWISFATLTASASAVALFSEAMWQRVWAAESRFALGAGACAGCGLAMAAALMVSFGGWLAAAWELSGAESPFFALFGQDWGGVLVALLALAMSAGAIDSLQHGVAAMLGGHLFKDSSVQLTRIFSTLVNMVLMALAVTKGSSVGQLLPVVNLLACCAAPAVALGLVRAGRRAFTETSCVVGIVTGVLGLTATGIALHWDGTDVHGSMATGAEWAWCGNGGTDWRAVLAALTASLVGGVAWSAAATVAKGVAGVRGPGVSGLLMRLPGMELLTVTPGWPQSRRTVAWAWESNDGPVEVEVRPGGTAYAFWSWDEAAASNATKGDSATAFGRATQGQSDDGGSSVRRTARVKIELSPRG